jgi:hypothetical protein
LVFCHDLFQKRHSDAILTTSSRLKNNGKERVLSHFLSLELEEAINVDVHHFIRICHIQENPEIDPFRVISLRKRERSMWIVLEFPLSQRLHETSQRGTGKRHGSGVASAVPSVGSVEGSAASGSTSEQVLPPPGRLWISMEPPWRSTIFREMESPNPNPPGDPAWISPSGTRKNGSKRWGSTSSAIPIPMSHTVMMALSSACCSVIVTGDPLGE